MKEETNEFYKLEVYPWMGEYLLTSISTFEPSQFGVHSFRVGDKLGLRCVNSGFEMTVLNMQSELTYRLRNLIVRISELEIELISNEEDFGFIHSAEISSLEIEATNIEYILMRLVKLVE